MTLKTNSSVLTEDVNYQGAFREEINLCKCGTG